MRAIIVWVGLAVCVLQSHAQQRYTKATVLIVNNSGSIISGTAGLSLKMAVNTSIGNYVSSSLSMSVGAGSAKTYYSTNNSGTVWSDSLAANHNGIVNIGCGTYEPWLPGLETTLGTTTFAWDIHPCPSGGSSYSVNMQRTYTWNGSSWSGGPTLDSTNFVVTAASFTNTGGWFDGARTVQWTTNGVLARTDYYSLDPGQSLDIGGSTNLFGAGVDYAYTVFGTGTIEDDFGQVVIGSGDAAGVAAEDPASASGTVAVKVASDPFDPLPLNVPTTTNAMAAARQDALGIAEAIRDLGQGLSRVGPTNGGGPDNSAVLERIRTNTLWNAEQTQASTNMLGTLTNFAHASTNALSATNQFMTGLRDATNQSAALWLSSVGHTGPGVWSNAVASYSGSWTGAVASGSGSPLRVVLPRPGYVFDLEAPLSGSLAAELFGAAGWLQDILIGVILMSAFWASYDLLMKRLFELQQGMASAAKFGGLSGSIFGVYLGSMVKVAVIEIVSIIIVYLPSIAVGFMDGYSWSPLGEGLAGKVNAGISGQSAMTNAMQRFYSLLGDWVPWTTLWVTIVNFLVFRLLLDRVANVAWSMIRGLGVAMGLAFAVCGVECEAATVVVENQLGTAIVVSNAMEQVSIEPGVHEVWLWEGDWAWGSLVLTVPDTGAFDSMPSYRFCGGAGTNSVAIMASERLSPAMGVWWGWGSGLAIFGFAWTVSAVREGVKIGHRGWESL